MHTDTMKPVIDYNSRAAMDDGEVFRLLEHARRAYDAYVDLQDGKEEPPLTTLGPQDYNWSRPLTMVNPGSYAVVE